MNTTIPQEDADRLASLAVTVQSNPSIAAEALDLAYNLGRVEGQLTASRENLAILNRIVGK